MYTVEPGASMTTEARPALSVIVVTVDRLQLVERLFSSLVRQTCTDFEVLLMYAPTLSHEAVATLCRRFPELPVRAYATKDTCLSRSRNAALPHLRGALFCIADDDCVYLPDTVARALEVFSQHPQAGAVLGQPLALDAPPGAAGQATAVRSLHALFQNCPSYVHFYRSSVLTTVEGFDEALGVGSATPWQSGEETDFLLRIAKAGFDVWRAPAVMVQHPRPHLHGLQARKVYGYAAGRMHLLRKHGCPWPFILANITYPLAVLPCECLTAVLHIVRYRWCMFWGRLRNVRGAK